MEINKAVEEFKKILNKKLNELESETKIESEKKMESGTIKLCPSPIQLDGLAFYKAPYKYYVKGTTLRLLCNMSREDLHAKNNNGWVGCDARNKAKRLIASNRKNIRYQKSKQIMSEDADWLKYIISFKKGKPFKFERQSLKDIKEFGKKLLNEEK